MISKDAHMNILYINDGDQGKFLMVYLSVDDFIFTDNSISKCNEFKITLMCEFEMTAQMNYSGVL